MTRFHAIPKSATVQIFLCPGDPAPSLYCSINDASHMHRSDTSGWTLLAAVEVPLPDNPTLHDLARVRLLTYYETQRDAVRLKAAQADKALSDAIANLLALPAPEAA